ncbi:hypothetical protein BDZ89DRAFT_1056102 [Hymenopellis radicata]|nr:hypothetical protein BDZ89DRAFT_1056102 [Hymenopellis radicata]
MGRDMSRDVRIFLPYYLGVDCARLSHRLILQTHQMQHAKAVERILWCQTTAYSQQSMYFPFPSDLTAWTPDAGYAPQPAPQDSENEFTELIAPPESSTPQPSYERVFPLPTIVPQQLQAQGQGMQT